MAKVKYNDITFDSKLEVEYYKYLKENPCVKRIEGFIYHPTPIPNHKRNGTTTMWRN